MILFPNFTRHHLITHTNLKLNRSQNGSLTFGEVMFHIFVELKILIRVAELIYVIILIMTVPAMSA